MVRLLRLFLIAVTFALIGVARVTPTTVPLRTVCSAGNYSFNSRTAQPNCLDTSMFFQPFSYTWQYTVWGNLYCEMYTGTPYQWQYAGVAASGQCSASPQPYICEPWLTLGGPSFADTSSAHVWQIEANDIHTVKNQSTNEWFCLTEAAHYNSVSITKQDCNTCTVCSPGDHEVWECEHQTDYYYYNWENCQCTPGASPILIDFDSPGSSIELTDADHGVVFDLLGTGSPVLVAWTLAKARTAFLVLDRNEDGLITSGKELFGNVTEQASNLARGLSRNGFLALSTFDAPSAGGNGDASITPADAVYSKLRLWFDFNHDGVSDPGELQSLASIGLTQISLKYLQAKRVDEFGNAFRYRSRVDFTPVPGVMMPPIQWAVDVFLAYRR